MNSIQALKPIAALSDHSALAYRWAAQTGGYVDLNELITRIFRLKDLNDVFEAMKKRQIVGQWGCEFD